MDKENIELNRETPRPPQNSEGREIQPADAEFYQEAEQKQQRDQRGWATKAEAEAGADKVKEIARIGSKETPMPEFEKTETGLSPAQHEKLVKNPKEWVNDTIGNPELSAYEQAVGMGEAVEEQNKRDEAA